MAKKKSTKLSAPLIIIGILAAAVFAFFEGAFDDFSFFGLNSDKSEVSISSGNSDIPSESVSFIDVGQGSSALLLSDGHAALIDGGEADQGDTVLKYLESAGVTKLDFIIGTHQHTDHIGGLVDVVNSDIEIEKIIMPKIPDDLTPTSYTYENLLEAISAKGLKITAASDDEFELGSFTINTYAMSGDYSDLNNYSVVTKITADSGKLLIMGDLETTAEKELLAKGCDLSADVLCAGHHGSSSSSGDNLLKEVNPSCAVISCGEGNSYGHPNEAALDRLGKYADKILRTDLNGNIVFDLTGEDLSVSVEKESE